MADIAASVLAKLRNKAKASGISYQQCLQLFVQEEFLRKLSKSGCEDTLILKGGLFIYTLTNFESRATIDVDFLLRGYSNSIDVPIFFSIPNLSSVFESTITSFSFSGR